MSWLDYVPIVGSVANAVRHPSLSSIGGAALDVGTGGLYTVGKDAYDLGKGAYDKYKGAIDEQKAGDLAAAEQAQSMGNNLYTEALGGLNQAEGYFQPAAAMLKNAYGSPGSMTGGPAQYPLAMPGKK